MNAKAFQVVALAGFALIFSGLAFAKNLPAYTEKCAPFGLEKIRDKAEFHGEEVLPETLHVSDLDDRWYNSSKYIWYTAQVRDHQGNLHEEVSMVQYYTLGHECI